MASASPAMLDEKAARVRDLLSSYYGTTAGEDATPEQPAAPVRQPRSVGLDSTAFDSDRYLAQLLKGSRLQSLLQTHLEMSTQIKSLDSDMQTLVYENYNKFISATDTIRTMKSSVDNMGTRMNTLKQLIGSIAERSLAVNSKLQLRRDEVEDLNSVRGLLVKLQAVFELPKRLRTAIDQGAVELAVDSYAEAAELLIQFGHKGAFRRVNAEVQTCVKELTTGLKQRLVTQKDEAAECIQLIRKLGEPIESLQDDYLACMKQRLHGILSEAESVSQRQECSSAEGPQVWGYAAEQIIPLPKFIVELDQRFITELARTAASFTELFEESGRAKLVKMAREAFGRYLSILKSCLHKHAASEASSPSSLPQIGSESKPEDAPTGDWGTSLLANSLSTIASDVSRLQTLLPELSAQDRGAEVVESTVRFHVGRCFLHLEQQVVRDLAVTASRLQETTPADAQTQGSAQARHLVEGYLRVSKLLTFGILSILSAMKGYQQQSGLLKSWQDVFVDLVQGQLQHLFLSLLAGIMRVAGLQAEGAEVSAGADSYQRDAAHAAGISGAPQPGMLLLLARLANFLEAHTVAQVMETLAAIFPGLGTAAGEDQPPAFVAGEVARRLAVGATALLEGYVHAQGARLSLALRRGLDSSNWREVREPRAPRPAFHLLLERLGEAESQTVHLLDDSGSRSASGHKEAGTASSALERNVARLFHGKVPLFAGVTFNQSSILGGIIQVALKAMVETIRLQTLSRTGLQQIQLDIHFLRQNLPRYTKGGDSAQLHSLLDEALAGATDRSLEPILLDGPVLEKILASSSGQ